MIPKTILLDLDDTLISFTERIVQHFTCDTFINGVTDYDGSLFDVCGCTQEQFYLHMSDPGFWEFLPWREDGIKLYKAAQKLPQDVMIMTALPFEQVGLAQQYVERARNAAAIGKTRWAQRYGIRDFAIVTDKWQFAGPGMLLIDDNPHRTAAFTARGGQAITVPQPWNDASGDVVELMCFLCEPIAGVDS
jgi:hypothetical protein